MTLPDILLLFLAAVLGGTLNSVAGGGSFFTFPALVFTGVPVIPANATNTIALWPGSVASTGAYRQEVVRQEGSFLLLLLITGSIGGVLGALLLLISGQAVFENLLPYLLLVATLLFTFSGPITRELRARLQKKDPEKERRTLSSLLGVTVAMLIISIYGGYFGGGIGILILATLAFMGMEDIHEMNGIKTLLTVCINGAAMVTFILKGAVFWPQALLMIAGAIVGGYGGAYYARKIEQKWVRLFVTVVGLTMTVYFFVYS
jgi:uncharacterized membrane protein YfcA